MNFKEALQRMKAGHKVKLPSWGGYWFWDKEKETVMMHTKDGSILDIRETQRVEYTLGNVLSDEWMLADESNTPILGGKETFNFGEALKYLKRGFRVARENWNAKDQYIYHFEPYANDHFKVEEVQPTPGTLYPYLVIKTNYSGIVPWLPSQTDVLAEDWYFVE